MSIGTKHRVFGLDVIRALAIVLVLFSHSSLLLFPNQDNFFLNLIRFFGAIGVDLFFVLSGFLIGGILLKQLNAKKVMFKDFGYFWIRRWFRTLPNYYFILILNIFLGYHFREDIFSGLGYYFLFLQNFSSEQNEFFTESWSLSIEEFAYVIGPLLLYAGIYMFKRVPKHLLFLLITVFVILGVGICRYYFHLNNVVSSGKEWSRVLRKVVVYRIDAIYYGFLAIYIASYFKRKWQEFRIYSLAFGMLLFFGMHIIIFYKMLSPENTPFFFNVFYLPLVSISLLLFFPFMLEIKGKGYLKKMITNLSVLSYSIYLMNYSIVMLTIQRFIDLRNSSGLKKMEVLFLYWFLSIYLSYLLYKFFEKPFMDLRDKIYFKKFFNQFSN